MTNSDPFVQIIRVGVTHSVDIWEIFSHISLQFEINFFTSESSPLYWKDWKFQNFSATQILREMKVGESGASKIANLKFKGSEFLFSWIY